MNAAQTPTFTAKMTKDMQVIINMPSELRGIISRQQQPIAISLPQAAIDSSHTFEQVMHDLSIEGRIFLAHKATASPAIISTLNGITSIDVASETELDSALAAGYLPKHIIATGPKSNQFLRRLSSLPDITIIVDSFTELTRLTDIMEGKGSASVLLRLTRTVLNQPGIIKTSRFGIDSEHLDEALTYLTNQQVITLKGLAFHLDSQSMSERQYALQAAVQKLLQVQQQGFHRATVLDIGGGYGTDYGVSSSDEARFEAMIKNTVAGTQSSVTWHDRSFGVRADGNHVSGELSSVDRAGGVTGSDRLRTILDYVDESGVSMAEQLRENLIELWIEPGSALCANAGMFVAEIIEVRQSDGEYMVVIDAHRNQVCFEGSEHIADPVLIPQAPQEDTQTCAAYLVGHLCMETDFMTYRKIQFSQMPKSGDLIAWTYTGAYRSHFSASQAIGHPLPAKYTYSNNTLVKDTYDI